MPLLVFPAELLLLSAKYLKPRDLLHLIQTNHFLAELLTPLLHELAFKDKAGLPAMYWAASMGHEPLVAFLAEKGVDINRRVEIQESETLRGDTPIHAATRWGHGTVVRRLLSLGANVEEPNYYETPIMVAASNKHSTVAQILTEHGADVDVQYWRGYYSGNAALYNAIWHGNVEMARILINSGANLRTTNFRGKPLLHLAVRHSAGDVMIINDLLAKDCIDINAQDYCGETALHVAVVRWNKNNYHFGVITGLLLEKRCDTDIQDLLGFTPLHRAVENDNSAAVSKLIKAGADVHFRNIKGDSAYDLAFRKGLSAMVSLLEEAGGGL